MPVISAVGHETDTTIADYVADLRAPTPSAAAELAVYDIRELQGQLLTVRMELNRRMSEKLERCQERAKQYERNFKLLAPASRINDKRQMAADLAEKLQSLMMQHLTAARHGLELYAGKLDALSPARKMSQGFAFIADVDGKGIRSVENLSKGDSLNIHMGDGRIKAQVCEIVRNSKINKISSALNEE